MQSRETEAFKALNKSDKARYLKSLLMTPNGKSAVLSMLQYDGWFFFFFLKSFITRSLLFLENILELAIETELDLAFYVDQRDLDVIDDLSQKEKGTGGPHNGLLSTRAIRPSTRVVFAFHESSNCSSSAKGITALMSC